MKNYLVIGASNGIGRALAVMLGENSNVIGTYFSNEPAPANNVTYVSFDALNDSTSTISLPETLDGIVYCPGSINLKPFHRFSEDEILDDIRLQVTGGLKAVQANVKALRNASDASVVFVSTVAVQRGFAYHTQVAISKGAVEGMTKALAAELAPHVRVNCVAPSLTDTQLAGRLINTEEKKEAHGKAHPLGRVGEPEDIANTIAFLLSEEASWISGQVIHVDGGRSTLNM
ncbi:SDR family oxidoreductase [Crocinitomicaceae bacterium]|nr:SDR family oxidoreductase [Crocinitomicaceae bacterium]